MFFAAFQDCRQIDIWGSIYACHTKACTDQQRSRIVQWLSENSGKYEYEGHLRHLPEPAFWQRIIPPYDQELKPGEFQNGAYWATPSGWYAELLESTSPGAGAEFLNGLVNSLRKIGIWECIGRDGTYRNRNNLSSVLLPYASYVKLLHGR
jgi:hypothetical protein